jgi:hypothetical protein
MHECWQCGESCDCDGEDHGQPCPDDCLCPCWQEDETAMGGLTLDLDPDTWSWHPDDTGMAEEEG